MTRLKELIASAALGSIIAGGMIYNARVQEEKADLLSRTLAATPSVQVYWPEGTVPGKMLHDLYAIRKDHPAYQILVYEACSRNPGRCSGTDPVRGTPMFKGDRQYSMPDPMTVKAELN
jgi:hypothetical protein